MSVAPVRGTQSFVSVMADVWKRPSLTALEIAWRWLPAIVLAALAGVGGVALGSAGVDVHLSIPPVTTMDVYGLQSISVFQPVAAVEAIHAAIRSVIAYAGPALCWVLPVVFVLWNLIAAFGRTIVLRRLDRGMKPRRRTLFVLGMLRSGLLLGAWWLWIELVAFSVRTAILSPAARNQEPSVVLLAAMLIVGMLLLYVLWAVFSWFLQLAPLLAMQRNLGVFSALGAAIAASRVSGKLIEINLVMNIVRIALLVLAMVFSATPLPFSTVTTPEFLRFWWAGVVLAYLAFSDYFHVVRAASYLSLYRALENPS